MQNKILFLEDNVDFALVLTEFLKNHNCDVSWTSEVTKAKKLFVEGQFDLVISDLHLKTPHYDSESSGFNLIDFIRNQVKSNVPIVVTTGLELIPEDQILRHGANYVCYKTANFQFDEFVRTILKLIK